LTFVTLLCLFHNFTDLSYAWTVGSDSGVQKEEKLRFSCQVLAICPDEVVNQASKDNCATLAFDSQSFVTFDQFRQDANDNTAILTKSAVYH